MEMEQDIRYQQGKIYKIVCNITNEIYIGSTIETLNRRLTNHKVKTKRPCMSKQILDRGDYKIELIKDYPCNNEEELKWEERKYIDNNICINKFSPIITEEEKIERKNIAHKNWYNKNKQYVLDKEKEDRKINPEKYKQREQNRKNKQERLEKSKIYGEKKIKCECGALVRRDSIYKHRKTMKHIKLTECLIID